MTGSRSVWTAGARHPHEPVAPPPASGCQPRLARSRVQGLVFLNSSRLRAAHAVGTQALRLGGGPKLPLQPPPPLVNGHSPLRPGHSLVCPQAPCPSTAWGPGSPRGGCKQVTGWLCGSRQSLFAGLKSLQLTSASGSYLGRAHVSH